MTAAAILAAGRSSRMGRPKAFLPHFSAENSFLGYLIGAVGAGGAAPVAVVGRPDDDPLRAEVRRLGAEFVLNDQADLGGPLSSILAAVRWLSGSAEALLISPIDMPLVTPDVVQALISAAARSDAAIVRAVHGGRHGHPVIFKRAVFGELLRADPAVGARAVVRAHPGRVLDLEVGDPGVLVDVDTPEDYARVLGRTL